MAQATPEYRVLEATGVGTTVKKRQHWTGALKQLYTSYDARLEQWERNAQNIGKHDMAERGRDWNVVLTGEG